MTFNIKQPGIGDSELANQLSKLWKEGMEIEHDQYGFKQTYLISEILISLDEIGFNTRLIEGQKATNLNKAGEWKEPTNFGWNMPNPEDRITVKKEIVKDENEMQKTPIHEHILNWNKNHALTLSDIEEALRQLQTGSKPNPPS